MITVYITLPAALNCNLTAQTVLILYSCLRNDSRYYAAVTNLPLVRPVLDEMTHPLLKWLITPFTISQYNTYYNEQKASSILITEKPKSPALASVQYQPCFCLCLGFSQITLILPFLLMTLHFSQIGFTEDLTFTAITSFHKVHLIVYHNFPFVASIFFSFSRLFHKFQ